MAVDAKKKKKTPAKQDANELKYRRIYQLRVVEGKTWRDIGEDPEVTMTHEGARRAFYKFIGEGVTEDERNTYRAEETVKIDQIEAAYAEVARQALEAGQLGSVFNALDGRLKCITQRTKINGLGQTTKIELKTTREDLFDKWDAFLEGAATATTEDA